MTKARDLADFLGSGADIAGTITADGLTVDGNPVINNASPQLFFQTGSTHYNWQIAAQESTNAAFEIASGSQDADATNDTYTKRLLVEQTGDIQFFEDTGTTPKLTWDASAESLGIGTSSPSSPLDIYASASGTHLRLTYPAVRTWNVGTQSGGSFAIRDANAASDRMTITTAGNVGIGTSSPAELIHIAGGAAAAYLKATNSAGTQGIEVGVSAAGDGVVNVQDAKALRLFTTDTERLRITTSGLVGIGTSSPSTFLHVNGGNGNQIRYSGATDSVAMGVSSVPFVGSVTNAPMTFLTNAAERMRIDSSGRVGIGTSSPIAQLEAGEGFTARGIGTPTNTSVGSVQLGFDGTNGVLRTWNSAPISYETYGVHKFLTSGTERLRIDSSGNLLVGTAIAAGTSGSVGLRKGSTGQLLLLADNGGLYHQAVSSYYLVTTAGGSTSDAALKTNITTLTGALGKVCAMRGVNFEFIEPQKSTPDNGVQIGVIAQEVEAQYPEAVVTNDDGIKSVRYEKLVAPLIEAIKEQQAIITALEARVAALEA